MYDKPDAQYGVDEITYRYPNFSGHTFEVWEWMRNFVPYFKMNVITYRIWD